MENLEQIAESMMWLVPVIIIIAIWDSVWKIIALWKSARNNHLSWFICIALINTMGILPIVYILMNRKKVNDNKAEL